MNENSSNPRSAQGAGTQQTGNGYAQTGTGFAQTGAGFQQTGAAFAQTAAGYSQQVPGAGYTPPGTVYPQPANGAPAAGTGYVPPPPPPPGYGRVNPQANPRGAFGPFGTFFNGANGASVNPSADESGKIPAKKKKTARDYAVALVIKVAVTAAALVILLTVFIGVFVCHNNSSYPMIKDGDLCMTSRLSRLGQGDIIAYKDNGIVKFGRIIAFGGDTVEIMNDFIAVNGFGLYEDSFFVTTPEGASVSFPYIVPEDSVFVLNDYRPDVSDSRTLGGVSLKDVKGKVVLIMRRRGI